MPPEHNPSSQLVTPLRAPGRQGAEVSGIAELHAWVERLRPTVCLKIPHQSQHRRLEPQHGPVPAQPQPGRGQPGGQRLRDALPAQGLEGIDRCLLVDRDPRRQSRRDLKVEPERLDPPVEAFTRRNAHLQILDCLAPVAGDHRRVPLPHDHRRNLNQLLPRSPAKPPRDPQLTALRPEPQADQGRGAGVDVR